MGRSGGLSIAELAVRWKQQGSEMVARALLKRIVLAMTTS